MKTNSHSLQGSEEEMIKRTSTHLTPSSPQMTPTRSLRHAQSPSNRQHSGLSSIFGALSGAIEVSVSRSTVIYDGQNTHIEAEEQRYEEGQWTQQQLGGTWAGDQSIAAIEALSRGRSALLVRSQQMEQSTRLRPLPRGKRSV